MRAKTSLRIAACALALAAPAAPAQVTVVNMIPESLSHEALRNAEPNLAVDPARPLRMAGSAFILPPTRQGVLFLSLDGGASWTVSQPMLKDPGTRNCTGFCDLTLRFGGSTGRLYVSYLTSGLRGLITFRVSRINDVFARIVKEEELESRSDPVVFSDQPYIQTATVLGGSGTGSDRAFVGFNELGEHPSATVDHTLDASPPAPAGFRSTLVESRAAMLKDDGEAVRTAIHADGTVYAVFQRLRTDYKADVVVVRDDSWAGGAAPFTSLKDSGDGLAGQRVASGVGQASGHLGTQRLGNARLSIAVDPRNSDVVYVAWGDGSVNDMTLHVRRSIDRGRSWSGDLRSVPKALNPALAVNSRGKVGFLYQQLGNPGTGNRWRTHVEISSDAFATPPRDFLLADLEDQKGPGYIGDNTLGDYVHLLAVGRDFYGVFSGFNTPDNAGFPNGVIYHRHAKFSTKELFEDAARTRTVKASIDPFFFYVSDIRADSDFYVRDWTDAGGHDEGQEPSTRSDFYTASDVWNRLTNTAGPFVGDAPVSEPPREAASGLSFAFVRVGRRAPAPPGSPAVGVTARFLYSDFGIGVPYAAMGPGADPVLTFNAADTEKTLADGSGFSWKLPADHSNHVCMAVEISAPQDPFAPPSLAGSVPGWPTPDLAVLNDNNRAQRNVVLPGAADNSDLSAYALIRNAAAFRRTVEVRMDAEPEVMRRLGAVRLSACGIAASAFKPGDVLRFPDMEPGEERMLRVDVRLAEAGRGGPLPLRFTEMRDGAGVNGFAVAPRPVALSALLREALVRQIQVFSRLDAAFKTLHAREIVKLTRQALESPRPLDARYPEIVKRTTALLRQGLASGPAPPPCGPDPDAELRRLLAATKGKDTTALVSAHARYLETLDAAITVRQHAGLPM